MGKPMKSMGLAWSIQVLVLLAASAPALAQTTLPVIGPRPGKAPPPPATKATEAYAFRTSLLVTPQCERFAKESDAVFLDEGTDIPTKAARLEKIEAEARRSGCIGLRQ
jgi:hypothetical protein